jgi:ATP-dependent DNA helicase RecG
VVQPATSKASADAFLGQPITLLKGVGPEMAKKYAGLGIQSVDDLLEYFPRRYDDFSQVTTIQDLQPGAVTLKAQISQVKSRYVRRGMHITEAIADDGTGNVRLTWFNQPYREQAMKPNQEYYVVGTFALRNQRFSIANPSLELVSEVPVNAARIVPVYRETRGLQSRNIRAALSQVVLHAHGMPERLPSWLIKQYKLMPRFEAVRAVHFPESPDILQDARRRLGFEEVFELVLASLLTREEIQTEQSPPVPFEEGIARDFVKHLPFQLTNAQRKVIWRIYQDMEQGRPMNRLVEGDVGSGKTIVAAMAALMVLHQGHQVAFMAPTELLARQHADSLYNCLKSAGLSEIVGLLVGGMKSDPKRNMHTAIASGEVRFIVGTHALIQETVDMHNLELIIIDEQHRFGVEQRKALMAKAGHMPHVLSLTATPIPRSLALTLYGELDISILDTKPEGRQPIITKICSPNSRETLYDDVREELKQGRQMFVVCPLISDSDKLDIRSAEKVYELCSKKDFKDYRVGLLHGKMKADEKQAIMEQFVAHKLDILVSTTVIEVGVDVPNASIMLIEAAERFGLAQAHQLRGRVGRGQHQGYCYLMMSDSKAPSQRLRALEQSSDGFKLAELDLELRGPGAIYGQLQHGALDLRIAQLTDVALIAEAREAAEMFMQKQENLIQYPELHKRIQRLQTVNNLN